MSEAYKKAGVNVEAGYEAVDRMKKHTNRTMRPEVLGGLGGFGAMFDISSLPYKEPVLISGTDGVGTKLMLAFAVNKHDTIGTDAVAMCVNDIAVQGAEPLYFLDYLALGKAKPEKIEAIVKGVASGCEEAGCALIGGETAEMPGMYGEDEYDLAGFTVGACEKHDIITGENIKPGDIIIGVSSSGIHSNGFSLVRKVLLEQAGLDLQETYAPFDSPLGEVLLEPTRIYVKAIETLKKSVKIKGMAHITGGGFYENIPRMLPKGLGAEVAPAQWDCPPVFSFIKEHGRLSEEDMYGTFNMGIGLAAAVDASEAETAVKRLKEQGEAAYIIGTVTTAGGLTIKRGSLS
ncbi:phosphoribosylformylglycinamidine cyclo-ligase [Alteribacillus persepolensis]|uniref:Phosphoribosylformylglycinamidine cyclo-ligase n=1 Tax=Alteribacillus persepolensis TaxID=568899 RepID=A0A1G8F654_9BACI|nr:phosphoribosylformylglycinamidine cyclo-ligase [Alteribacillus persepolensis]SDH77598.1 phosphoribosylformylglycinamidine cyclo-ligase [Alteribacillus persepolensis]